jgi:hypothetical protein
MAPAPASLSAPNALSLPAPARVTSGRWNRSLSVSAAARSVSRVVSVASAAAVTAQRRLVAAAAATEMAPTASGEDGSKPFVEEMREVAMKLHTKDQAREGEKEPQAPPVAKWEPSVEGYLRFLVDSKLVFQTLEAIVERSAVPWCECSALLSLPCLSWSVERMRLLLSLHCLFRLVDGARSASCASIESMKFDWFGATKNTASLFFSFLI